MKKKVWESFTKRVLSGIISLAMVLSTMMGISFVVPEEKEVEAAEEEAIPLTGVDGEVNIPSSMTGQKMSDYYSTSRPTIYFGGIPWTIVPGSDKSQQNQTVADTNWLLWANEPLGEYAWNEYVSVENSYEDSGNPYEDSGNPYALKGTYTLNNTPGSGYVEKTAAMCLGDIAMNIRPDMTAQLVIGGGYGLLKKTNELVHKFTSAEIRAMKPTNILMDDYLTTVSAGTDDINRGIEHGKFGLQGAYLFPLSYSELTSIGFTRDSVSHSFLNRDSDYDFWTRSIASGSDSDGTGYRKGWQWVGNTQIQPPALPTLGGDKIIDAFMTVHSRSPYGDKKDIIPACNLNPNAIVWIDRAFVNNETDPSPSLRLWSHGNTLTSGSTICTKVKDSENNSINAFMKNKVCNIKAGKKYTIDVFDLNNSGSNQYISAALYDFTGSLTYYGKVAKVNKTYQTITVQMPENMEKEKEYTLALFEETSRRIVKSGDKLDVGGSVGNPVYMTVIPIKPYSVTFDARGGNCDTPNKTVTCGDAYGALPVPTKAGYTFDGWYTKKTNGNLITPDSKVTAEDAHTLYAHWTPILYKVHFNANGGSCNATKTIVISGETYGALPTPTRTGYTFDGWYTASSGGTKITADSTVNITSDQTLYAHWTPVRYKVFLNGNRGTCYSDYTFCYYNNTYGILPMPFRDGYNFNGWYTDSTYGNYIDSSTLMTTAETHSLYAHWTPMNCVVNLDPNGGTCTPSSKTVTYDNTYSTLPTPSRTGYTFHGWNTEQSGGGEEYYYFL